MTIFRRKCSADSLHLPLTMTAKPCQHIHTHADSCHVEDTPAGAAAAPGDSEQPAGRVLTALVLGGMGGDARLGEHYPLQAKPLPNAPNPNLTVLADLSETLLCKWKWVIFNMHMHCITIPISNYFLLQSPQKLFLLFLSIRPRGSCVRCNAFLYSWKRTTEESL